MAQPKVPPQSHGRDRPLAVSSLRLAYVLPAHNEAAILERNTTRLARELTHWPGSTIMLVENGSVDDTWLIANRLAERPSPTALRVYRAQRTGLGHAFDRALRELERATHLDADYVVLGAADFPFGVSDLDAARGELNRGAQLVLGSKAHARSHIAASAKRKAASIAYRMLRRHVLGMRTGDCQGSLIIERDLALKLRPHIRSRDYFYTTELVFHAEKMRVAPIEVPVTLHPDERKSTVSIVIDGARMFQQLVDLRIREGKLR